jgi:hypothetical protein
MTDPAKQHERAEAAPLADARRNVAAAASALRAAVHLQPALTDQAAPIHAALCDQAEALQLLVPL